RREAVERPVHDLALAGPGSVVLLGVRVVQDVGGVQEVGRDRGLQVSELLFAAVQSDAVRPGFGQLDGHQPAGGPVAGDHDQVREPFGHRVHHDADQMAAALAAAADRAADVVFLEGVHRYLLPPPVRSRTVVPARSSPNPLPTTACGGGQESSIARTRSTTLAVTAASKAAGPPWTGTAGAA